MDYMSLRIICNSTDLSATLSLLWRLGESRYNAAQSMRDQDLRLYWNLSDRGYNEVLRQGRGRGTKIPGSLSPSHPLSLSVRPREFENWQQTYT